MQIYRALAASILGLALAVPAQADTTNDLKEDLGEAFLQLFEDMQPHLEEALEMLEGFEGLNGIDDPRHYRMPEVLPNGDIIIRRREDAPAFRPDVPDTTPDDSEETIDL